MTDTLTAYWDIHYASQRRVIPPLEQVVRAFLFTLPVFATALLVIMHWTAVQMPAGSATPAAGNWSLSLRDLSWDTGVITVVLLTSFVLGVLPALAEYWQTSRARTPTRAPPAT